MSLSREKKQLKNRFRYELIETRKVMVRWDPILGGNCLEDEYDNYLPMIIKLKSNRKKLLTYLENLLTNTLGLSYDKKNPIHKKDIEKVIDKIQSI